jgi:ATP synthase F1 gamma subunit
MATVTRLKQELQFNGRLAGLLDALKAIAAQQFQALERSLKTNEVLFRALRDVAATLGVERLRHPFTQRKGPTGVIAVTSDTGLLGGLNQQVIIAAAQEYAQAPGELMVIGERGVSYVKERGLTCRVYPGAQEDGRGALASRVRDDALARVLDGHLGGLTIVYPRALSFTVQRVELLRVLPCIEWLRGGEAPAGVPREAILVESPLAAILEYLVRLGVGYRLHEVLGLSRLAELAARAVHLEGSSQELQRRRHRLMVQYFRQRRELIDRGMRELFAARALYKEDDELAGVLG